MAKIKSSLLEFHSSLNHTLGVEVEIQILDPQTGDLVSGAVPILKACQEESLKGVSAEFKQSMIEIKTEICASALEAEKELYELARKVRNIATSFGYELAMAGTHPFSKVTNSPVFPSERYERLLDKLAWIGASELSFGVHIHVGVRDGDMAISVMNSLAQYLPHLLALSASSPFWQGVDTGLASARAALYRLQPRSGVPPYFSKWKDFKKYMQVMLGTSAIESFKDIYWDIRPRPDYGTLEIRIFDAPSTISQVVSFAALTRSLVIETERFLDSHPGLRQDKRKQWIAMENMGSALRYGLSGVYFRTLSGKKRSIAHDLSELISRLLPISEESKEARFLKALLPIEKFETGSERQRRLYRESGSWKSVIDDMIFRFSEDIESYFQNHRQSETSIRESSVGIF